MNIFLVLRDLRNTDAGKGKYYAVRISLRDESKETIGISAEQNEKNRTASRVNCDTVYELESAEKVVQNTLKFTSTVMKQSYCLYYNLKSVYQNYDAFAVNVINLKKMIQTPAGSKPQKSVQWSMKRFFDKDGGGSLANFSDGEELLLGVVGASSADNKSPSARSIFRLKLCVVIYIKCTLNGMFARRIRDSDAQS
ncbi:hypothetical protein WN51_02606 [Melipona quadrifasciata]|uniref:Uncharacterized protein n=1 Tax=Melipona quadrifasciata TaxID=166423 RepID=A0A0M8ZT22_9HYME|nr:hypothetical protein WN51_02606 [Melipona quadrifasciata]